jgi:diguanylate cyclase (GGDEF)-like protein
VEILMNALPELLQLQLKACRTLPSVPAVVLQVLDLCQDESASIGQVAKALARDPALSGKVLKVANSPWYGVRSQVTTLERAITILGINATLSLALSFSLVHGLRKSRSSFDHQAYWLRSVTCAAASRAVGEQLNAANHEELFLGGLLQDIGILVLNEAVPDSYSTIVTASKGDHELLTELERQEYGSDHADVGAWQLARWNLPVNLQQAAALSHHMAFDLKEASIFSKCVALAGDFAGIWTQADPVAATAQAREKSISLFGMSSGNFDKLLGEIAKALPEVTANLDINIGGEDFVEGVLDQARGALVELSLQAYRRAHEVQLQAQRDDLTSLANRSYLNEILPQLFVSARELNQPLSVLFLDVDNFKTINDSHGHQGGDSVLASVARVLRLCTREFDTVARYGGDEFVILLSNTSEKAAADLSKRIRTSVMVNPHPIAEGIEIPVTISIGCATMSAARAFQTAEELVEAADRCLYAAKMGGRNQVVALDTIDEVLAANDRRQSSVYRQKLESPSQAALGES